MMAMDVDLRMLRYVVVLAEELHFGRAASRLFITQQTLSAQVARLEERFGQRLFVRDSRRVQVTEFGAIFVAGGRRLLDSAQDFVKTLEQHSRPIRVDVVSEGLTPSKLLRAVRLELPDLSLEILQSHGFASGSARLARDELELAFGRISWSDPQTISLFSHELVRLQPIGILMPATHPLAGFDAVPMSELSNYPLLLNGAAEAAVWCQWNEQLANEFSLKFGRRVRVHGRGSAIIETLSSGMPTLAPLDLIEPGLVNRPVVEPIPVYPWSMVWCRDNTCSSLEQILEKVREIVSRLNWLDPPDEDWWLPASDRLALTATTPL